MLMFWEESDDLGSAIIETSEALQACLGFDETFFSCSDVKQIYI